jgi:predicted PP-loop superfamily ATPase
MIQQSLIYQKFTPLELSNELLGVYEYVSNLKDISTNPEPPMHKGSSDIIDLLYTCMNKPLRNRSVIQGWNYKPIQKNNQAYVAFSGGKDGIAKALLLKKKGYDVTLIRLS